MSDYSIEFSNDPTIRRIRGLLNQAKSAASLGNQDEANAFNEKASALIAKYGVDQANLADKGQISDPIITKMFSIPTNYAMDQRVLLSWIVRALGCKSAVLRQPRPGTWQSYTYSVHVFAHQSDMDRIGFLFELLAPQMILGAASARCPSWENARSFRKSWMQGFASAIYNRLQRTQKEAVAEASTGTDLVLLKRDKAVEVKFTQSYPSLRSVPRTLQGSGREQGYAAGQRANMGTSVTNGSRAAAIAG